VFEILVFEVSIGSYGDDVAGVVTFSEIGNGGH
jgi:hypothetical protein